MDTNLDGGGLWRYISGYDRGTLDNSNQQFAYSN